MAKVTVYTTNYCPFCSAAKALLGSKGVDFEEIAVDNDPDKRAWLKETTHQMTVPQIFINDQSIGGFQELKALDDEGKLDEMLK